MLEKLNLNNKVVLVTGGGSGIGYQTAKLFIEMGATVWIASRNEAKLKEAKENLGHYCKYEVLDIRKRDQVDLLFDKIKLIDEKLDILVNNAGGQFPSQAEDITEKGWNAVINNNLNGTWNVIQSCYKHFFEPQNHGIIINIIANIFRGFPGMAHTGAARAGVDNLTKSLAVEWAKSNVRINAIAPGIIATEGLSQYPDSLLQNISNKIPMKKLGKPEDVANLALFLSTDLSAYITGETIYVDGGMRLWGDMWEM